MNVTHRNQLNIILQIKNGRVNNQMVFVFFSFAELMNTIGMPRMKKKATGDLLNTKKRIYCTKFHRTERKKKHLSTARKRIANNCNR